MITKLRPCVVELYKIALPIMLDFVLQNEFTGGSFILFYSRSHWMLKDEFFHMNRTIPEIPRLLQQDSGSFQTHLNENTVAKIDGH